MCIYRLCQSEPISLLRLFRVECMLAVILLRPLDSIHEFLIRFFHILACFILTFCLFPCGRLVGYQLNTRNFDMPFVTNVARRLAVPCVTN